MWLILPKHNVCWSCKLDHAISFNSTVWFGNQAYHYDHQNFKIIFMIHNKWINACNAIKNFEYINGHSSHLLWLNHGYKIECLHPPLDLSLLRMVCPQSWPIYIYMVVQGSRWEIWIENATWMHVGHRSHLFTPTSRCPTPCAYLRIHYYFI